jgi:hypothetical protein
MMAQRVDRGGGHGHRHSTGEARCHLRAVRADRQRTDPHGGRHWSRPDDQPRARARVWAGTSRPRATAAERHTLHVDRCRSRNGSVAPSRLASRRKRVTPNVIPSRARNPWGPGRGAGLSAGRQGFPHRVRNDSAPETLGVIFDPFVQVDGGLTRTVGARDCGLTISRALARAIGGDLTARERWCDRCAVHRDAAAGQF